ncbi:MAG: hypothetical protein AB7K24_18635 [Gemmataceae bacterium]
MKRTLTCSLVVGLIVLVGCSSQAPEPQPQAKPAPELSLLPTANAEDANWGTVKGRIVWGGDAIPERKPLNVDVDKDHCLAKGALLGEDWVVNPKNKGVKWTFVWLDVAPKVKDKLPIHPDLKEIKDKQVTMDQPMCAFEPRAVAVREGQELVVKNSAPVAHNVNYRGLLNAGGNFLIPAKGQYVIKDLVTDRLPLTVECNIHKWMKGRILVLPHPYFAVTDADGNFEIKNAPAGEWYLKVYHDSIGWRGGAAGRNGEKINIKGGGTTDVGNLEVKPAS